MRLKDEMERMTDFKVVYEPFRRLSIVGGHRNRSRLLSYLLHLHVTTGDDWVEIDDNTFRIVDMSPYGVTEAKKALLRTEYVKADGKRLSVEIPVLMRDVQRVHDTW